MHLRTHHSSSATTQLPSNNKSTLSEDRDPPVDVFEGISGPARAATVSDSTGSSLSESMHARSVSMSALGSYW